MAVRLVSVRNALGLCRRDTEPDTEGDMPGPGTCPMALSVSPESTEIFVETGGVAPGSRPWEQGLRVRAVVILFTATPRTPAPPDPLSAAEQLG